MDNMEEMISNRKRRNKKGIIYLSTLPEHVNVNKLREMMENFGEVGRIFLQSKDRSSKLGLASTKMMMNSSLDVFLCHSTGSSKAKSFRGKRYAEGWVEFEKKRVAKEVAQKLNGKKIECPKRSKLFDVIWSIKYLSK